MQHHLIRLASAPFISSRLAKFGGWVGFPRATRGKHNAECSLRRVGENSDPILNRLWTKVHKIFRRFRKPLVLSMPFCDCLCYVSFRRYSQLSLEVVEKPCKCKSFFGPNFCRRDDSDFSTAVCLVEFRLLVSVCEAWQWSAMRNLHRVGKNAGRVWSRLSIKVHDILATM